MDYPHHPELLCQLDQGVLSLQLNRPARKNALHSALYLALENQLQDLNLEGAVVQGEHLWLAQRSLVKPRFITYHGWWSLGRSLDLLLASPLEPPQESTKP